jgi:mannose-6-phosphate isomerase-like protein (cupin superfamily)
MQKKSLSDIEPFIASDKTLIREVWHPKNDTAADKNYSLAFAELPLAAMSTPHILTKSSELYIVTSGRGLLEVGENGEPVLLETGDSFLVPAGMLQRFKNVGDTVLKFYCIVSPAWSAEGDVNAE